MIGIYFKKIPTRITGFLDTKKMDKETKDGIILALTFTCLIFGVVFYGLFSQPEPPVVEKDPVCTEETWVQVTHRDGFWYCHDDDMVAWVTLSNRQEWRPATMIEKRRINNQIIEK